MPKKFFDIIPPEDKKNFSLIKNKNFFQKVESDYGKKEIKKEPLLNLDPGGKKGFNRGRKKRPSLALKIIFSSLFILVLIGVFSFLFFSEVKIKVWPKTRILNLKTDALAGVDVSNLDFEKRIIPSKIFEHENTASKNFSASGKMMKEEKAKGIIRVFNKYSTSPQPLLAKTRFVSDKGKLFRSLKREIISGGHYEKGKFIPGFTDIKVIAAEPGENYNIGPSTFSIPGFKGTVKYTYFYGKSFSNMTGGFKGEVSQVTAEDIKKAESILSSELKQEDRSLLEKVVPQNYVLPKEMIFQKVIESKSSVQDGSEAESFNLEIKVKSRGVALKRLEAEKFVERIIVLNILESEKIQKESLEVSYSPKQDFFSEGDNILKTGKVAFTIKIKTKIYQDIKQKELKKALIGKSQKEVKSFLEDFSQVAKIKIESWPFLRRRVPSNIDKIELELNL